MASNRDSVIASLMKHRRGQLIELARQEGIHTDDTMTKQAICVLLFNRMQEREREARESALLEKRREEVAAVKPDLPPEAHNLNAMVKPATYAILAANKSVFGGILAERVDTVTRVHRVLTGSGQRWEFPL